MMRLRKPPQHLDPAALQGELEQQEMDKSPVQWHTYSCTLVTPMYGGGVVAGEVDEDMPVRAGAIRGQLRFWWRLLARQKYGISDTTCLREAEFALWGGVEDKAQASKVWLRVSPIDKREDGNPPQKKPCMENWRAYSDYARYALFPLERTDKALAKEGWMWKLNIGLDASLTATQTEQVQEALRWWACFGGLGARTRRGLGAVRVEGLKPVSEKEVAAIGGRLVLGKTGQADALKAWQQGIGKLRDFRQKEGLGRNPGQSGRPGRSCWPEPDAIRRLAKTHYSNHASNHAPEHKAGNVFPRAAFGLPIIFDFGKTAKQGDPEKFTLKAYKPGGSLTDLSERMGSPVLIRPYHTAGKWYAAALLLPCGHIKAMSLSMPDGSIAKPEEWWQPEKAWVIKPMQGLGNVSDALEAFLAYFADKNRSVD